MARVTRVAKSRSEHICSFSGHTIPKGEPYMHASPGFRTRRPIKRCTAHPFRPSDLTTSMASAPMAAAEAFSDTVAEIDTEADDALESLQGALDDLIGSVTEYRDDRSEALSQWPHGNSTLEDLLDTAEAAVSEVEAIVIEGERDDYETAEEWFEHVGDQIETALSVTESLEF